MEITRFARWMVGLWLFCLWPAIVSGDDFVSEVFDQWRQYEGLSFRGRVRGIIGVAGTEEHDTHLDRDFVVNIARTQPGSPPKYEVCYYEDNPGEPHIDAKKIIMEAEAFIDGARVLFTRHLISQKPPSARLSVLNMNFSECLTETHLIMQTIVGGVGIRPVYQAVGKVKRADFNLPFEILGETEYLGLPCYHIGMNWVGKDGFYHEWYTTRYPSIQPLKLVKANLPDDYRKILERRTVVSAKNFGSVVVPTHAKFIYSNKPSEVWIHSVVPLPDDHVGIFDYDKHTGVILGGKYADATARGSGRIPVPGNEKFLHHPYTDEEAEKIRKYLLMNQPGVKPKADWLNYVFWAFNIAAVFVIGRYVYLKVAKKA
ncbi:hypothetical protein SH449x_003416 [Pirellulaceae bacterium SH449]